jgi:hypothetical protein
MAQWPMGKEAGERMGSDMTKQTAIREALAKLGLHEVKNYNTTKYRVFKRRDARYYFVGKAGSLCCGMTISDSFSADKSQISNILNKATKI